MEHMVRVENVNVHYERNHVIKDVSFSIDTGQLIGIIGPNGAGKSTLIKAMLGLVTKNSGSVHFSGKSLQQLRKQIAYVPQRNTIDWDFPITVRDTVLLGTYPNMGLFQRPNATHKKLADECLEKVDLLSFKDRQISELSGGQQQRVFLARALAQSATYFFLDEPFVGIDVASEATIITILKQLRDEGKTIFVVHHDLSKVKAYFDQLLLLNRSLIQLGPAEEVIRPELVAHAYQMDTELFYEIGVGG